jgi:hypothetical protein
MVVVARLDLDLEGDLDLDPDPEREREREREEDEPEERDGLLRIKIWEKKKKLIISVDALILYFKIESALIKSCLESVYHTLSRKMQL